MVNLSKKNKPTNKGDFVRVRNKVGRVKAGAVNATDTFFQTRRLAVRTQALSTAQKVAAYAQKVDLEKDSLLAHLQPHLSVCVGHPSASARREAFSSILQKCRGAHGNQLLETLFLLAEAIGPGLVDREGSVRTIALALMTFIMSVAGEGGAEQLGEVLVPFVLLAGSHIDQGVQRDGVRSLEGLLRGAPRVLPPWTGRIFGAFSRNQGASSLLLSVLDQYLVAGERAIHPNAHAGHPFAYVWTGQQRVSLASVRLRRVPSVELVVLGESELSVIINWLGAMMLRAYGEVAPRIRNPQLPGTPTSEERTHMAALRAHADRLGRLAALGGGWDRERLAALLPTVLHAML